MFKTKPLCLHAVRKFRAVKRGISSDVHLQDLIKRDNEVCRQYRNKSKYLTICNNKYLVHKESDGSHALLLKQFDERTTLNNIIHSAFVSTEDHEPIFAVSVDEASPEDLYIEPRQGLYLLKEQCAKQATIGLNLLKWQADHKFCSKCASEMVFDLAGRSASCSGCKRTIYPRYNPVVIMLVVHGDYCVLARQTRYPSQVYSALAGFVDVGESVEEAVAREVKEEVNVSVGDIQYNCSQFWGGFIRSTPELMIGCIASTQSMSDLNTNEEIEEAKWFHKDEIREALTRTLQHKKEKDKLYVPPPFAAANQLLQHWCKQ